MPTATPETAERELTSFTGKSFTPDILIADDRPLPRRLVDRVARVRGVVFAESFSFASVPVAGEAVTVVAADPHRFRRFAPRQTAKSDPIWDAVARGDAIVSHSFGRRRHLKLGGSLAVGPRSRTQAVRVGAYATTVRDVELVVNEQRGARWGLNRKNGLLVSIEDPRQFAALSSIRRLAGNHVYVLGGTRSKSSDGALAYLAGGAVADAMGTFRYRAMPDGFIKPDLDWVRANIRTERMPLLGQVTCHRVMLPQLRAALSEIASSGLSGTIKRSEYGGCYVPRFIGRDPRQGLSLHSWGIAVDLNVPENQRGTAGEIDRRVVQIFKKWGFAWGGDWQWTDPMHFELAALVRPEG